LRIKKQETQLILHEHDDDDDDEVDFRGSFLWPLEIKQKAIVNYLSEWHISKMITQRT
jgi:hypothetical protein